MRFLLTLILFAIWIWLSFGEKVPVNEGFGWDGVRYHEMAVSFTDQMHHDSYDTYHMQRVLPFALINWTYQIFQFAPTNDNLMTAMMVENTIALIFSVLFFFLISERKKLSIAWEVIGFSSIFYCFPILKMFGYAPWITDIYATLYGISAYYFYISNKKLGLFVTAVLATFTWPSANLVCLALLFLKTSPITVYDQPLDSLNTKINWWIKWIIPCGIILYLFLEFAVLSHKPFTYEGILDRFCPAKPLNWVYFVVSVATMLYYLYRILKPLTINVTGIIHTLFHENIKSLCGFILSYMLLHFIVLQLSNGQSFFGPLELFRTIFIWGNANPFMYLENYFLYFGFSIVLIIIYWRPLTKYICEEGIGYTLVWALIVFFSLRAEARIGSFLYPLILFPLLDYLNRNSIPFKWSIIYAIASLIFSHFWLPINVGDYVYAFRWIPELGADHYLDFPAQIYFMNHGHWQCREIYFLYSFLMIVCYLFFNRLKRKFVEK